MILYVDLETRSKTPIDVGVHRYAQDARITLVSWAFDEQPVAVHEWDGVQPFAMRTYVRDADLVIAHNAEFDFTMLDAHGVHVPLEKRYCTMAQARRHGLPGGLDKLCEIFRLPQDLAKMKEGRALVLLFCKPRPDGTWADSSTHPVEWAKFKQYAGRDVVAMRELHKRMPKWNDELERPIWLLDQIINERGFHVDRDLAQSCVELLSDDARRLDGAIADRTHGAVERGSQRDRLLQHIFDELGIALPDLQAGTIERRLADPDVPEGVKELLRIRQQSSKTSTAKYATVLKMASDDDRMRGTLVYCGAGRTGRWAGKGFQPHNLPRPKISNREIELGIRAVKARAWDLAPGATTLADVCAYACRGVITAAPGRKLLVADLANIEGRVVAWLANEQWKLDAFRAYDSGEGPDLYRLAYALAFDVDPDSVTKDQRQIGKVMELMLGFGGGVGAFITGAATYRIDLEAMAAAAWPNIGRDVQIEAQKAWARAVSDKKTLGLAQPVYEACDALKRLWRRKHPAIEQLWYATEDAAKATTRQGGIDGTMRIEFERAGAWLRMRLPTGRYLCYPSPKVDDKGNLTFLGQSPYTRKWQRQSTWGGTLVENATQATARDVLAHWMVNAEAAGLSAVLTVHDEIICEVDADRSVDDLVACLPHEDFPGLPLTAKGFEATRYRKDD